MKDQGLGYRFLDFKCMIQGFVFHLWGSSFGCSDWGRVSGFGTRDSDFRFEVHCFGFSVSWFGISFGFCVSGLVFRDSGFGFRVSGFGFRISGFGFELSGLGFGFWVFRFRASVCGFWVLGFGFRFKFPLHLEQFAQKEVRLERVSERHSVCV